MAEYHDFERLHVGRISTVLRARDAKGTPVIIKQVNGPQPTARMVRSLDREFELTEAIQGPGTPRVIERTEVGGLPAIVFADIGGRALGRTTQPAHLPLLDALQVGAAVARILARVHEASMIHRDVNPSNIVFEPRTGAVELIDFGIATRLVAFTTALAAPEVLQGTLAYLSPEQTGRMNRRVDYRSDLYSLGATLYQLLCDRPPFVADNALQYVHSHIALTPTPPHDLDSRVPRAVSDIVMRLLAKDAESRYQSAHGVAEDLERCGASLQRSGRVDPFPLGEDDVSHELRVPDRLYGRQDAIDQLFDAWTAVSEGAFEMVLVAGYAGIGKTALVREVHRPMSAGGGRFVSGKFEQYNRGTPYASLLQAFESLIGRLLTEPPEAVAQWRELIQEGLGTDGAVLVSVLPGLELIVGEQTVVAELPSAEAAIRFDIVFRRFVRSLCDAGHPLVLFFDDLQWADLPSLKLLQSLAADPEAGHLLIIGAYRENEVHALHPLQLALTRIAELSVRIRLIRLQNLSRTDTRALVADTLRISPAEATPLANLCFRKTRGNPFFLRSFIELLAHDGLLRFDRATGWTAAIDEIEGREITDNVVDFMSDRLHAISPEAQDLLSRAAFLGTAFDLETVSRLTGTSVEGVRSALDGPLSDGLVEGIDDESNRFVFAHDRVQQAAYDLCPVEARAALHLEVGRLLLASDEASEFDAAYHLDAGRELITDPAERSRVADLHRRVGEKALRAAAYDAAHRYLSGALELLGPGTWESDYERTLSLHLSAARASYLSRQPERLDALIQAVLDHARSELDKVAAHEIGLDALYASGELNPTLDRGLEILRLLGIDLPDQPGEPEVVAGLTQMQEALAPLDAEAILALPASTDRRATAAAAILHKLASPAFFARPTLLPLIAFELVQAAVRDGIGPESQFGFVVRGLFLCLIGDIPGGIESGRIASELSRRSDAPLVANVTRHVRTTHVRIWTTHWNDLRDDAREVFRDGHDLGDFLYACFGANMVGSFGLFGGAPLEELLEETRTYLERMVQLEQGIPERMQRISVQLMHNLRHGAPADRTLSGEDWDAASKIPELVEGGDASSLYVFYASQLMQQLILGDYAEAAATAEANQAWLAGAASSVFVPNYTYMDALALLQAVEDRDEAGRELVRARADAAIEALRGWAVHGPTCTHRVALLEAERARVFDPGPHLSEAYAEACRLARESEIVYDEALANELAGRYCLLRGHETAARGYLSEARHQYERWGSTAKSAQMERAYAGHLHLARSTVGGSISGTVTRSTGRVEIDSLAVIRSSRAIAQEIQLSRLVEVLLATSIESTGARRGLLILAEGDHLVVEARGRVGAGVQVDAVRQPLDEFERCPASILRYVERTHQTVLLADASEHDVFRDDPWVMAQGTRSVLCVPLEQQGRLIAILYLENERTTDTFHEQRVEALQLILSQAAISIENARLISGLEGKVADRTRELVATRERSDQLLLSILPEAIATELKDRGRSEPVYFPRATVLFTDFVGFTQIAEALSPAELVEELDQCFSAFDKITHQYGLEKLKTIGDSYMCAGGIPQSNRTHAIDAVLAGLSLQSFMRTVQLEHQLQNRACWELRLGIHTGPLIAGVIGSSKFAYDVWGKTVNTASRMESSGEPGRVNVSEATWQWAQHLFEGTPRGEVFAKNMGAVPMFFVDRIKPEYSADSDGRIPNDAFRFAREAVEARLAER